MHINRIAAAATVIVIGVSSVALANAGLSGDVETDTTVRSAAGRTDSETRTSASIAVSTPSTTFDDRTSTTHASLPTTVGEDRSTTSTTFDDRGGSNTSTTFDDRRGSDDGARDESRTRTVVELDLHTYTVGEAGTITVDGMTLVAIDANPGWKVEIDEVSASRIKIEFERDGSEVRFELRSDGELRIRTDG
jgi:hypothetical protein